MNVLSPKLRRDLEKATIKARDVAEEAAQQALERLGVSNPEPFLQMTVAERELRNKLRAKGRQLGDIKFENRKQSIHRLIAECAYEHWHQMLFARFLAENNLLMNSDNVPVTLVECEELSSHEGASDGWMLASRYASRMLPQIFRPDDAVLQVQFAPEHLHELETILSGLPTDVFTADDSLGWVYQFWQSKKKDQVNKSEKKIGADELPAVTQLFTEDYMVLFLLHNTIGAWWVANHSNQRPPIEFEYLRFADDGMPAAGSYSDWPKRVRELTVLDPCCGSGHFLVAAFIILVNLLLQEEGITVREASDLVLRNSLFGLEIDQRCTQIAAFNLAFAAWKFPNAGGYRVLPQLNIACSGLSVGAEKNDWRALANGDTRLKAGMERLYGLFEQAPTLGSLINPRTSGYDDMIEAGFRELEPLLNRALQSERIQADPQICATAVAAHGIAEAANIVASHYTLIATNVPYLGRSKQVDIMRDFCEKNFPDAKADLATCLVVRSLAFCASGGSVALVTPQNWLFQGAAKGLRQRLLRSTSWDIVARLGPKGFQTPMWDFNIVLVAMSAKMPGKEQRFLGIDVSEAELPQQKAELLVRKPVQLTSQSDQHLNPDSRITIGTIISPLTLLNEYAESYQGLRTGDLERFIHQFWELASFGSSWVPVRSSVDARNPHEGVKSVLLWENGSGKLAAYAKKIRDQLHDMHESGNRAWNRKGIALNHINIGPAIYSGEKFDANVCVIIPKDESNLAAIWAFC